MLTTAIAVNAIVLQLFGVILYAIVSLAWRKSKNQRSPPRRNELSFW
jgi:hypothetical protein